MCQEISFSHKSRTICFKKALQIWVLPFCSWKKIPLPYIDSDNFRGTINQFFPSQKCFIVPCIFTCVKKLLSPAKNVKANAELFDKLNLAIIYSSQQPAAASPDLLEFTKIKKRLPNLLLSSTSSNNQNSPNHNVCNKYPAVGGQKRKDNTVTPAASKTSNNSARVLTAVSKKHTESRPVQRDEMNTETLERYGNLLSGPHSAAFVKKYIFWQMD